jgi:hypothetical protein
VREATEVVIHHLPIQQNQHCINHSVIVDVKNATVQEEITKSSNQRVASDHHHQSSAASTTLLLLCNCFVIWQDRHSAIFSLNNLVSSTYHDESLMQVGISLP